MDLILIIYVYNDIKYIIEIDISKKLVGLYRKKSSVKQNNIIYENDPELQF